MNNESSWLEGFTSKLARPFVLSQQSVFIVHSMLQLKEWTDYSVISKFAVHILNKMFLKRNGPDIWQSQIILPILKPGKIPGTYSSYKPLALSSVLAKIMEHSHKHQPEWILENKNIISRTEFSFRNGMGTMDSLSILTSDIMLSLTCDEHITSVFLDFTTAYMYSGRKCSIWVYS